MSDASRQLSQPVPAESSQTWDIRAWLVAGLSAAAMVAARLVIWQIGMSAPGAALPDGDPSGGGYPVSVFLSVLVIAAEYLVVPMALIALVRRRPLLWGLLPYALTAAYTTLLHALAPSMDVFGRFRATLADAKMLLLLYAIVAFLGFGLRHLANSCRRRRTLPEGVTMPSEDVWPPPPSA